MHKKILLLGILLSNVNFIYSQSLISIVPNTANINQTLNTTVTASGFFFTMASTPMPWDTYFELGGYQIIPNWVNVIDDDHLDINLTVNPGFPTGAYTLVKVVFQPVWPFSTYHYLFNAFTVYDSCSIVVTPLNGEVCQGDSVRLSFSSSASTFQWKLNGVNIPGATHPDYYAKTSGNYTLAVTGNTCTGSASPVTVSIIPPPTATIAPSTTQHLCPGQSVTFFANTGTGLTYQWYKNGVAIPGASQYSLLVKDSGSYKVTMMNSSGCTNVSAPVKVTIYQLPSIVLTKQPGSSNGKDARFDNYSPNVNFGNDILLGALSWTIGGTPLAERFLIQFDLSSIPPGSEIYFAELNLYFDTSASNQVQVHYGSNYTTLHRVTGPWSESTVTWNNQPAFSGVNAINLPASATPFPDYKINVKDFVQTMIDSPSVNYGFLMKLITESPYRSLLFGSSDYPAQAKRPKLVVKYISPSLTASNGFTLCNGDSTTLVTNTGPYTYQWKKNGNVISSATASSYIAKTTGTYTVKITNNYGCSTTSEGMAVTVNPNPTATITPAGSTSFCTGDSVVLAGNSGTNLSYQWKKNNTTISGATNRKYTAKTAGSYKVKVTNVYGCSRLSSAVTVTVPCREGESAAGAGKFTADAYPNPSRGDFHFRLTNGSDENVRVRIYDLTGRMISDRSYLMQNEIVISDVTLPGMYKAEVIQGENIKVISLIKTE